MYLWLLVSDDRGRQYCSPRSSQVRGKVRWLLGSGCDVNCTDPDGRTALHYASQYGNLGVVEVLVSEFKADVTLRSDVYGCTSLMLAALYGHSDIVQALLHDGQCSLQLRDNNGWTVLHHACSGTNIDLVQILIRQHQLDVNVQDYDNDTPLNVAAWQREITLALIKEFGGNVYARNISGRTCLHSACVTGEASVVKCLGKYMSILVFDKYGNTPLHLCSARGHSDCVEALLLLKAPVLIRNSSGETAQDVATGGARALLDSFVRDSAPRIYDTIQKHARKRYSKAQRVTRVFVIGESGAGKSTLIEAMKRENFLQSFNTVSESSVPPHTAGIVPTVHISKLYGRLLFYDFASGTVLKSFLVRHWGA